MAWTAEQLRLPSSLTLRWEGFITTISLPGKEESKNGQKALKVWVQTEAKWWTALLYIMECLLHKWIEESSTAQTTSSSMFGHPQTSEVCFPETKESDLPQITRLLTFRFFKEKVLLTRVMFLFNLQPAGFRILDANLLHWLPLYTLGQTQKRSILRSQSKGFRVLYDS